MAEPEVVILGSDGKTEHVFPAGFDPQKAAAIVRQQEAGGATPAAAPAAPGSGLGTMAGAFETAKDLGKGFAKAGARTVQMLADDLPHAFGGAGLSDYIDLATGRPKGTSYGMVTQRAQSSNPTQRVGGMVESAAEMAIPVGAAAEAVPTAAKAGKLFQSVEGAAKGLAVDVSEAGKAALRISELSERGASMPKAVRDFLKRVTDPDKGNLVYEEARDFASNLSRLSANERMRLSPMVGREVAEMTATLNRAIANTAGSVGKGAEYAKAMTDYARAMKIRKVYDTAIEGAKKGVPYFTAAGAGGAAGYWLTKQLSGLLSDE